MGQAESAEAAAETQTTITTPTTNNSSNPISLESALAEAAEYGNQNTESVEAMSQKALECPCIADLRTGPCGSQFSEAFLCFLKSTAEEKGSDCVHPFVALQSCIKANPDAFSKDILGEDESKELEPIQEYKIIPPKWSKESQSPKSKL
ncbi:mitochondrial intermembrane space import and assembly protein 40 homolog [Abrus precatorius]|uniref:Mitochondrial intermembrane space import and assembly protein 40 homolog n=1 Tax=Abrus precatorius TaxID=3816 RepID=A0A8B8JTZ4_ABRPR|nr:mitochondrial intermembrane space import and assembly protein 40 homolog [Abrus precatorius]XP_027334932.1 mitochondrial intermembrane space import and assembly protein 40 homolog [Abrus precatorius]XP_027334933.1 mitochondrial intermembrane space import and assembly protein 40 homolog [Abrus precatorius]